VGSFGCNLRCPFCQNHEISQVGAGPAGSVRLTPQRLAELTRRYAAAGSIGLAFTYNEPLVGHEFVIDTARLVRQDGLCTVVVTNGTAEPDVLDMVLPYIDAFNIDLKSFSPAAYHKLGGDLPSVMAFIAKACRQSHVELTTLVVPGISDDSGQMDDEAAWIASLSPDIPLHITRYFPAWHQSDPPTSLALLQQLAAIAASHLHHVHIGNV